MKLTYLLLIAILFPLVSFADGDSGPTTVFKLKITFEDGTTAEKYIDVPRSIYNPDSINDNDYFFDHIIAFTKYNDSLSVFGEKVIFTTDKLEEDGTTSTIISLYKFQRIAIGKISRIDLMDTYYYYSPFGIANELSSKDEQWMSGGPLRMIQTSSYSCDFYIFQFEEDPKLNAFILDFTEKCQSTGSFEDENMLFDLLKEIKGKKVVFVGLCTC